MAANPNPAPDPNQKLVRVFEAGIDCDVTSIDAAQGVLPIGGTIILVREEDVEKARQLIEEYRRAPGEELSEDFSDTGEGGAQ